MAGQFMGAQVALSSVEFQIYLWKNVLLAAQTIASVRLQTSQELAATRQYDTVGSNPLESLSKAAQRAQTIQSRLEEFFKGRRAYETEVRALAGKSQEMLGTGQTVEEVARTLSAERRALGVKYKDLTPPDLLEQVYARNVKLYGDPLGPTIEYLRDVRGLSWEQIIESAAKPSGQDIIPQLIQRILNGEW